MRIAFADREERGALRLFLRALRRASGGPPVGGGRLLKTGAVPTLRSSLRHRVQIVDDEELAFNGADIVVAASLGQVTAPGVLVRALGAGAVPLAARVPVYEEVLRDGDLGAFFQVGDVDVLASQLERLIREDDLRTGWRARAAAREELAWSKVADQVEAIYGRLAALRHDRDPKPEVRARVARTN